MVYGLVSRARRLYLGVYADIALDGGILLIETRTGRTLVKATYRARLRRGGVPFSPLGLVAGTVLTLRHITDEQMLRAIDDLGRDRTAAARAGPLATALGRTQPFSAIRKALPAR